MKHLLLLLILVVAGCNAENKLLGKWVSVNNKCEMLCGFTIIESENAYSNMKAEFDKGPFYKGANGPLVKIGENRYLVKGNLGDFLIVLKNGKIYSSEDGSVFERK